MCNIFIIFIFCFMQLAGATLSSLADLPVSGNTGDQTLVDIVSAYKDSLNKQYSDSTKLVVNTENAEVLNQFNLSLFNNRVPGDLPTIFDSQNLLNVLRSAYENIYKFIYQSILGYPSYSYINQYLLNNFRYTLNLIEDRYGLALIEDMVINGDGFIGDQVIQGIPDGPLMNKDIFRDTIKQLVGRIFVVKDVEGVPTVVGTSSGMIIPYQKAGSTRYDQVVTCCHSMMLDDHSPDLEFYFVKSNGLNLGTGLPKPIAIGLKLSLPKRPYDEKIDCRDFVKYLRQQSLSFESNVRRIVGFKDNRKNTSNLKYHAPRHQPHEDCGYAILSKSFVFISDKFAEIRLLPNIPRGAYEYYALGYPDFPYYDTAGKGLLVDQLRLAPLTMTRSYSQFKYPPGVPFLVTQKALMIVNGRLRHAATTMKGMSGGPIVIFDQKNTTINILGIITSGLMDLSYASKLK